MRISHVAVWARDIDLLCSFYTKYFGGTGGPLYRNPAKGFSSRFITFDGETRLEIMHRESLAPDNENSLGFAHIAISVGSKEAVDGLTARLRADGCVIVGEPRLTGDGFYESVVSDPEGNLVEITV